MFAAPVFAQRSAIDFVRPDSIIDLRTDAGAAMVNGQWR
jgi:hypothetical protein